MRHSVFINFGVEFQCWQQLKCVLLLLEEENGNDERQEPLSVYQLMPVCQSVICCWNAYEKTDRTLERLMEMAKKKNLKSITTGLWCIFKCKHYKRHNVGYSHVSLTLIIKHFKICSSIIIHMNVCKVYVINFITRPYHPSLYLIRYYTHFLDFLTNGLNIK